MVNRRYTAPTYTAILLGYLIALVILTAMPAAVSAETAPTVYIVTIPGSNYQTRVANTLIEHLSLSGIDTASILDSDIDDLAKDSNAIFITFEGPTSKKVRARYNDNPQLNITYNGKYSDPVGSHSYSSLVLTQPTCRLVLFVRKLAPAWKSAGIITSKYSSKQIEDIRQCAEQYDIAIRTYHVDNEKGVVKILDNAVAQNDVLLALPDTVVYNSRSIKNILLTAYRHRKPVIGYSNSLVKAGAVAAIYTSAEDAGIQAAEIISEYISHHSCFNRSTYTPSEFTISINRQVARALDISIDVDENLNDDMDLLEIR